MARARSTWQLLCRVGGPIGAAVLVLVGLLALVALAFGAVEVGGQVATALDRGGEDPVPCEDAPTVGSRANGKLPKAKVILTPRAKEIAWAFDASRDPVRVPIVITASPPLTGVASAGIEIIATPLVRSDNHEQLPKEVAFTTRISRNGERSVIRACLDPRGATAGRYLGSVFVGTARPNVASASVDLVVTARSPGWFGLGMLFILAAIVVVLTLKGVADYRREIAGTTTKFDRRKALVYIWSWDGLRLVSSLIGIGAAVFVGLRIYNTDRIWGDDAYQDSVAMAAAAITAVGTQGIFDGFLGAAKGGRSTV